MQFRYVFEVVGEKSRSVSFFEVVRLIKDVGRCVIGERTEPGIIVRWKVNKSL